MGVGTTAGAFEIKLTFSDGKSHTRDDSVFFKNEDALSVIDTLLGVLDMLTTVSSIVERLLLQTSSFFSSDRIIALSLTRVTTPADKLEFLPSIAVYILFRIVLLTRKQVRHAS
jgi:hypothetical protein